VSKSDNLTAIWEPIVYNTWSLDVSQLYGPPLVIIFNMQNILLYVYLLCFYVYTLFPLHIYLPHWHVWLYAVGLVGCVIIMSVVFASAFISLLWGRGGGSCYLP
jgi:hypothetical protein